MDPEGGPDRASPAAIDEFERLANAASIAQLTTTNLAPEATQVHQLTTFEVLTALNGEAKPTVKSESVIERLIVPERARWWQRQRHRILEAWSDFKAFVYRNVPHGVKNNRLGIQWTSIGFVVMIFQFISPPKHQFWGPCWLPFANFIAINALTTIEMATGATNRNAGYRILGTTLAAVFSFAVLVPMVLVGWEGQEDSYMVRWIMYYACTPSPFIWNFFLYHYPTYMHENFTFQGLSTQVYLFGSNSRKIVWDMCICTIGCYIGTVIGFIGYQLVIPLRARDKLTQDISLISYKLSYSLEPLIELESGTKTQKPRHTVSKLPLLAKSLSKVREWRAGESNSNLASRGSKIMRRLSVRFMGAPATPPFSPQDEVDRFRSRVWDTLADCSKLMERHEEILAHARREHYWSKPHFFYYEHFKKVSEDCMALYYHVSSLFLIFQAQMSTTPKQAVYNNLPKANQQSRDPTLSPADFGGLFLDSGRLIGSDKSDSALMSSYSAAVSPMALSVPILRDSGDYGNTLTPIGLGPPATVTEMPILAPTTAVDSGPERFYSPLEALSASKIPKHDLVAPIDTEFVRQMTVPLLKSKQSSLPTVAHAATCGDAPAGKYGASSRQDTTPYLSNDKNAANTVTAPSEVSSRRLSALQTKKLDNEYRGELLEAVQEEKNDVMDSLASVKNLMTGQDGSLAVPKEVNGQARVPTAFSTLTPPVGSPSALSGAASRRQSLDSGSVHVGGVLDILVNAPSDVTQEAPIAPAKIVGLAPVVKWAEVFGPMFGEIAENMGHALELIGECLDFCQWNPAVWKVMDDVEASLARLVEGRRNWWQVSEEMAGLIASNLYRKDCVADQGMYDELEEKFCLPWLGLTLDAYGLLPTAVKDDLWVSFENMQDRQTMAVKACEALASRLKLFALSSHAFLELQFPSATGDVPKQKPELSKPS